MNDDQRDKGVVGTLRRAADAYDDAANQAAFLERLHGAMLRRKPNQGYAPCKLIVREYGGTERALVFDHDRGAAKVLELMLDLAHARAFRLKQVLRDVCREIPERGDL